MSDAKIQPSSFRPQPFIFILRSGALGDFILTLPALQALRRKYATHHFILSARADVLPLVQRTLADQTIPFDSALLTPLFTPDAELPEALAKVLSDAELAVLWLPEAQARIVARNLRRLAVQRLLSADPMPIGQHAADHLVDSLAPLGIISSARVPTLTLSPELRMRADEFWRAHSLTSQTRVMALHVGSGGERKRWPLENFLTLAHQLALLDGVRVLLISGPAEENLVRPIIKLSPAIVQLDSPDLSLLTSILARCVLYIGNDSGITHLAAALGAQTIALFGPTDPNIWGPRGAHVSIIRSPSGRMDAIAVESVWQIANSR